jgi:hypothetical protein
MTTQFHKILHNVSLVSLRSHNSHDNLAGIVDGMLSRSMALNVASLQWHDVRTEFNENLLIVQNVFVEQKQEHTDTDVMIP